MILEPEVSLSHLIAQVRSFSSKQLQECLFPGLLLKHLLNPSLFQALHYHLKQQGSCIAIIQRNSIFYVLLKDDRSYRFYKFLSLLNYYNDYYLMRNI